MESGTLQVFLRVLYTVNSNPQYILAKSSSQILVTPCSGVAEEPAMNEPTYARAPLKACLTTLCDSSPELLQDSTRDFSLYFLDPLETKPLAASLAHASCSTDSPRGVAVALGLMSWALESDNSMNVYVTGTIMPNISPALEVVCALRETRRMPKPMLQSYPPIVPMHASNQSQLLHAPRLAQNSGMSRPHTPRLQHDHRQQQQQTLTRSADFPELYIGPPRRARGRPEGSTSSKSTTKVQSSTTSLPGPSSLEATNRQSESKRGSKQKAKPRPPRPPPTYSPFICAPLTRTARSESDSAPSLNLRSHMTGPSQDRPHAELHRQTQSSFHPTDNPLMELVSAISSTSGVPSSTTPEQQAALISVLQGLFAANPDLLRLAATSEALPANIQQADNKDMHKSDIAGDQPEDSDSDIIILDSSTIDTTVFRKPGGTSQQVKRTDSPTLSASMLLPAQEDKSASSQKSTPSGAPEPTSTVIAGTEKSEHDYSTWVGRSLSPTFDMPATPTPSRTRKRKLDEYSQDRAHWFIPTSPPSPSQSVTRVSSSAINMIGKHSLSTGRTSSVPSCSARLPSMLGSLRGITTPASHPQSSSSGHSAHSRPASLAPEKNEGLPDAPLSGSRSEQGIELDACSLKRRRTLSEFMEEHEARKSVKPRKYSSSGRRLGPGISTNIRLHADSPRSANLESTSGHALSSPSRPLFRSDISAFPLPASVCRPGLTPSTVAPSSSLSSMTSMGSSTASTATQIKNPLKNFVMPAWARTSTAMLPRLSEEALARQKAEREAKKAQASLRRREATKAKRKRPHHVDPPLKDSSDEDETGEGAARSRTPPPSSSAAQIVPGSKPPLSALPVFASDAVAPIAPSSPRSHRQPTPPSTPPRRHVSMSGSGSGSHRTPSKSDPCSLFTPSSHNSAPLFTPSTPSVPSLYTRVRTTPRSPLMLGRPGGTAKSPRKGAGHTPRTPRRSDNDHPTPRGLRTDRHQPFASPSVIARTLQTGMGTRAFLLPPTSPCVPLTPQRPQGSGGPTPTVRFGTPQQPSALATHTQSAQREGHEDDTLIHELNGALRDEGVVIPSVQLGPIRGSDAMDNTSEDVEPAEVYHSSPLPPSSPLPASPLSSPIPAKHGKDTRAPTASDADVINAVDTAWLLSDDGLDPTTAWVNDSDAGAWFTESEAWLTDVEGGPLPTDSDAAWLSDSDAISSTLGDLTCSLPSWLSDGADGDETDSEVGKGTRATGGQDDTGFDTAAFRKAYAAFVDHAEASIGTITNPASARRGRDSRGTVGSNSRESIRKGEGAALSDTSTTGGVPTLDA